jgi:curved DNA-binding protein CbpA
VDHYERLRVSRDAPLEVIRAAYRALAAKHHPDRHGQSEGANFDMALLNGAYEVLSDPITRAQYDAELRAAEAGRSRAGARPEGGAATGGGAAPEFSFSADSLAGDAAQAPADSLGDIDWDSLKAPPSTNPWLSKKRLLPLAVLLSAAVIGGVVWWIDDLANQMEAERSLSAHLGQKGSPEAMVPQDSRSLDKREQDLLAAREAASAARAAASGAAAAELPTADALLSKPVPGVAPDRHMLDGEPLLSLHLDVRPNPSLQLGAAGR